VFENTKGLIRIRKSKDRQHNDQKEKGQSTNNDSQNTTQKTKDRATRTPEPHWDRGWIQELRKDMQFLCR